MKTNGYLFTAVALSLLLVWSGCYTVVSRDAFYRSRVQEEYGAGETVSDGGEVGTDASRGEYTDENSAGSPPGEAGEGEGYEAGGGVETGDEEYYGTNEGVPEVIHHHYYHYYPDDWRWRSACTLSWYYDPLWDWCWPRYVYVPYVSIYYDPWYWDPWYWGAGFYWGWSYPMYYVSGPAYWYGYDRGWWDCGYYYYGGGGGGTAVAEGPKKVRPDRLGTFGISRRRYYASSGDGAVSSKIRPRSAGSGTVSRRSRSRSPDVLTRRTSGDRRNTVTGRTGSKGVVKPAARSGGTKTVTRTQRRRTAVSGTVSRRSGRTGSFGRTTRRSTGERERSFMKPSGGTTNSGSNVRRAPARRPRANSSNTSRSRRYNAVDTYYYIHSKEMSSRNRSVGKSSAGGRASGNFLSGYTGRRSLHSYSVSGPVGDVYTGRSGSRSSSVNGGSGSYSSPSGSGSRSTGVSYRRSTGGTRSSSSRTTRSRASSSHTRRRR